MDINTKVLTLPKTLEISKALGLTLEEELDKIFHHRICTNCGGLFHYNEMSKKSSGRCKECYNKTKKKRVRKKEDRRVRIEKICVECATEFIGTNVTKYCSKTCSKRAIGRNKHRRKAEKLSGNYVRTLAAKQLGVSTSDIPDNVIKIKRKEICLKRKLKQHTSSLKE